MNHRDKRASENNSGIYILNIKEENASTNNKIDKAGANKTNKILEVNFKNMKLIYPEEGNLLRNWQPGLNTQYRTSRNMFSLKCCINNLQVKPVDRHKRTKNLKYFSDYLNRLIISSPMPTFQFHFIKHLQPLNHNMYHFWT